MRMRRSVTLIAGVLVLALAATAVAQDACVCQRRFARAYSLDKLTRKAYRWSSAARGVPKPKYRKVGKGIYDYYAGGYVSNGWCKSNRRACNALKACLVAAGASMANDLAAGSDEKTAARNAATACAGAAAGVWVVSP